MKKGDNYLIQRLKQLGAQQETIRKLYFKLFRALPKFPTWVVIEQTNNCNYNCIMCPNKIMKSKRGFMPFTLYEKIIAECEKYKEDIIQVLALTGRGESLLHPKMIDMLGYAKQRKFKEVRFSTNASVLSENISDDILKMGVDRLILSLNAATEKTYKLVSPNSDFKKVESNVRYLLEKKKKLHLQKPYIEARITKIPEVVNELDMFVKKWEAVVDKISISEFYNWAGAFKHEELCFEPHATPCEYLWNEMRITWEGDVVLCCWDYESTIKLGNVNDSSLYDIWHNKKYNDLRKMHIEGNLPSLCKSCGYYKI